MAANEGFGPIPGGVLFEALRDKNAIIMATNIRFVPGVAKGIFKAAKDTNTPVIIEIARSECNLERGYIGHTPETFARAIKDAAKEVGFGKWALHADHIGVKKGDEKEIAETKKLILAQIEAGFTSFAIDASHIYNFNGKTPLKELEGNIKVTKELAHFIKDECKKRGLDKFGLEVEVGEIGKKDADGFVITTVEEAVTFVKELNKAGIFPHTLAVSNGTSHGNVYKNGVLVSKVSIDIPQTKKIAEAMKKEGFTTRLAQHGITGTPLELIATYFPKGDILKGNVGTQWQNIVFDVLKIYEPELYEKIRKWVIDKYSAPGKSEEEVFGTNVKQSFLQFFGDFNGISSEAKAAIEAKAYADALMFYKAFGSLGKGTLIAR